MVHAGEGYRVNVDSLTHDERGYPATFAEPHDRLVRRLVAKIQQNAHQIIEYEELFLDDAQVVVVAYGCTARSARRAVALARQEGVRAGLLRLITLWPFAGEKVWELSSQATAFVVPELNLGQMITQVERFTGRPVVGVNHAGGAMIPPEPILDAIREVVK